MSAAVVIWVASALVLALVERGQLVALVDRPKGWFALPAALIAGFVALFLYYGFVRLAERREVTELSRKGAGKELRAGLLVGFWLFTFTIGLIALAGSYRIAGIGAFTPLPSHLAAAIFAGVVEEVVFRALLLRMVEDWLGTWVALVMSVLLFGALHLANPQATLWGASAIALEGGLLLGAAFVFTRRLWLAIGIHAAWNFTQGGIFGLAVSGNGGAQRGLVDSELSGSPVITGGVFGGEASIFAALLCLAAAGVTLRLAWKAGRIVPPTYGFGPWDRLRRHTRRAIPRNRTQTLTRPTDPTQMIDRRQPRRSAPDDRSPTQAVDRRRNRGRA
jgi:membrane protease YdiL (CAAX protease family)